MEFNVKTSKKQEVVDITSKIAELVKDIKKGTVNVYVPHATAAIMINENADPNLPYDILEALNELIPQGKWKHDRIDNNGAAHIKAAIFGPSETIPIKDGELQLGTWQDIFLADFDGPRNRRIIVNINKN